MTYDERGDDGAPSGRDIGDVDRTCGRPLMSWLTAPVGGPSSVGVVIVPPSATSTGVRTGRCGRWPSAWPSTGAARCASISTARGTRRVTSGIRPGCRPGGAGSIMRPTPCAGGAHDAGSGRPAHWRHVCPDAGRCPGADAVVAWAPVVRGRRYVSELQLLGLAVPEAPGPPGVPGASCRPGRCSRRRPWPTWGRSTWPRWPTARHRRCCSSTGTTNLRAPLCSSGSARLGVEPDHVVRPRDGAGARSAHRVRDGRQ